MAGIEAVAVAIREGEHFDRVYIDAKSQSHALAELKRLAAEAGVPVNYVPAARLTHFNVEHDGAVALRSKVSYVKLQDLVSFVQEQGKDPFFVILDGITDIRNIGGIARSAYALGAQGIIIPEKGVGALNEDAILTSAGALEKIAVCRVNSLMKAVDELHMNGIRVLAADMEAAVSVTAADFTGPVAIVLGSEDRGISKSLLKICDEKIAIPMPGQFESLNVSVAAGIILFEASRQREKK